MAYIVQTWVDNNGAYALSAARMSHIEAGIDALANSGSLTYASGLLLGTNAVVTTNPTLDVRMAVSQTGSSINVSDSGGVQHGQWFGNTGNLLIGNAATGGSGSGVLSLVTTTAPSGTPASHGGWLYVDPADGDAKVTIRNPGGTAGVTRRLAPSHEQILMEGLGYKSWAFDPVLNGSTGTNPTAGTVYVRAMPLRAGQVITNTVWQVVQVGVGTAPTSIFTGIADSTGKMVAQSNDSHASAIWTTAAMAIAPLSATYTVPADGLYYAVFLQVGSWGTTQMTLGRTSAAVIGAMAGGIGTTVFGTGATTAQTALPANGSSIAGNIVTTNGNNYFVGAS